MKAWRMERSGWRDQALSMRHGFWGFNCPAADLDFVMVEYNHGKPCAIVEYKHKFAKPPDITHATYRALVALADGYSPGALPCFIATYDPEDWSFVVTPLNKAAKDHFRHVKQGERLTEQRFVKGLHMLRKSSLSRADNEAISQLNGALRQGVVYPFQQLESNA
jgi:hypothetical protein